MHFSILGLAFYCDVRKDFLAKRLESEESSKCSLNYSFEARRESQKCILQAVDSRFHATDSGFQTLDSSLCQWNSNR